MSKVCKSLGSQDAGDQNRNTDCNVAIPRGSIRIPRHCAIRVLCMKHILESGNTEVSVSTSRVPRFALKAAGCLRSARVAVLPGLVLCANVFAAPLGIVSDNGSNQVNIFNADQDVVTSMLDSQPGMAVGDCAVTSNEKMGFTTSNNNEITFLSLDSSDQQSAAPATRVAISNLGVDMTLSPDDAFLVMAGGGSLQQPLSVVDTALELEVATAGPFVDHTSVEFCDNGTMLVTTTHGKYYGQQLDNALYDVDIDQEGQLALKGHRLSSGAQPNNAVCAPGSLSGVLLDREGGLTSFTLPEMETADYLSLGTSTVVAAVFSSDGRNLFVRTRYSVQAYEFDPISGAMSPGWKQDVPETSTFFGIEQIAIHPEGNKLYVDGGGPLLILDPETGSEVGNIELGDTTGICFANNQGIPLPEEIVIAQVDDSSL